MMSATKTRMNGTIRLGTSKRKFSANAAPGKATKLTLLITVPTMLNATAQPGRLRLATKYSDVVFCLRPTQKPTKPTTERYSRMAR